MSNSDRVPAVEVCTAAFSIRDESDLRALAVKIMDDILFCGGSEYIDKIIGRIQAR